MGGGEGLLALQLLVIMVPSKKKSLCFKVYVFNLLKELSAELPCPVPTCEVGSKLIILNEIKVSKLQRYAIKIQRFRILRVDKQTRRLN